MLNSPPPGGDLKNDYLERVLKARVYDVAIESPLELAAALSKRLRNRPSGRERVRPSLRPERFQTNIETTAVSPQNHNILP